MITGRLLVCDGRVSSLAPSVDLNQLRNIMRKLTLRTAAALALATCFSSIASAQTADPVDFYYEGPLDSMGSQFGSTNQGPLGATAARSETQYRSVQSAPPEPQWRGVRSAPQQPQYQGALTAPRQDTVPWHSIFADSDAVP